MRTSRPELTTMRRRFIHLSANAFAVISLVLISLLLHSNNLRAPKSWLALVLIVWIGGYVGAVVVWYSLTPLHHLLLGESAARRVPRRAAKDPFSSSEDPNEQ
jgi:uncharacterized membrane protein YdcZ (DUF606 family)